MQNESAWFDGLYLLAIALPFLINGYGVLRRRRWSWYGSMALGWLVLTYGIEAMWKSTTNDPYNNMEGGLICGIGLSLALPSLVGVVLLAIPALRLYMSSGASKRT